MQPFTDLTAIAVPLLRPNVDTDAIIPSREIKGVSKAGLAEGLFAGWRYTDVGGRIPRPDFVLNDPAYRGAAILLGGENFGCGSSREHAVWALAEYGFRAIVADSFSPIFQNNCIRNGVLACSAPLAFIAQLAERLRENPRAHPIHIDLATQTITLGDLQAGFSISEEAKDMLMSGSDVIGLTLRGLDEIRTFIAADRRSRPWAYLPRQA
jgi:3-isopropylmalate/(R)-2-methylmalate dehydratase small subunit